MTPQRRQREVFARKHRGLSTGLETVDAQWRAYHRYIFQICAAHLSPSDDLVQFAITVAEPPALSPLSLTPSNCLPPTVAPSFHPRFSSTSESLDRVERQAPPLMMSDLATAAEMMEIDGLDAGDRRKGWVRPTAWSPAAKSSSEAR